MPPYKYQWIRYAYGGGTTYLRKFSKIHHAEKWLLTQYPNLKFRKDKSLFGGYYYDPNTGDSFILW